MIQSGPPLLLSSCFLATEALGGKVIVLRFSSWGKTQEQPPPPTPTHTSVRSPAIFPTYKLFRFTDGTVEPGLTEITH